MGTTIRAAIMHSRPQTSRVNSARSSRKSSARSASHGMSSHGMQSVMNLENNSNNNNNNKSMMGSVPSLRLPSARSEVSSVMSACTAESERMDELVKVRRELEDALRQVKQEMREGGATKSQCSVSTSRSQSVMSDMSAITASTAASWDRDLIGIIANKKNRKLATIRGRAKMDVRNKADKPLVARPMKTKSDHLPPPSPSAFRHKTHVTSNQSEYVPLNPAVPGKNQGPTKSKITARQREIRPFSKACENQVACSSITGSKVFATRTATR